jgi:hypothetical protein
MSQLFQRKPIAALMSGTDAAGGLKRTLGAGDLIMLAIGAVIGAGIFGAIGTAAAGQVGPNGEVIRAGAGPALVLSFILLGGACALAALCYAELAAMIPQAGSAYAYSYATLGELVAWIIGWDLILEYAVGNVAVAISWGDYFNTLLRGLGLQMPVWLTTGYRTALLSADPQLHGLLDTAPHVAGVPILIHVPAFAIVMRPPTTSWSSSSCWRSACSSLSAPRICTRKITTRLRRTDSRASIKARRSCSSRISVSTQFRRPPKRPKIRSGTCRLASLAGSPSVP